MPARTTNYNCEDLRALLASDASAPDDELAARIAAHVMTCPTCRASDADFHTLLRRYCCTAAPPLDAALESRLLDRLCARLPG